MNIQSEPNLNEIILLKKKNESKKKIENMKKQDTLKIGVMFDKLYVFEVDSTHTILDLKKTIQKKLKFPYKSQIIIFQGVPLLNGLQIIEYLTIKDDLKQLHQPIFYLTGKIPGGTISGFPDIGEIVIITIIMTVFMLSQYLFYQLLLDTLTFIPPNDYCPPINKPLNNKNLDPIMMERVRQLFTQIGGNTKTPIKKIYSILFDYLSLFFSSLLSYIFFIYGYCVKSKSGYFALTKDNVIFTGFLSMIFIPLLIFLLDRLKDRGYITMEISMIIIISVLAVMNIILYIWSVINKYNELNYSSYLFPWSVVGAYFLINFVNKMPLTNILKYLLYLVIIVVVIYVPFLTATTYNSVTCKDQADK